jgi:EAL domain-containing protein (putative c-di-GMP-specific phosphodiesterase class I)
MSIQELFLNYRSIGKLLELKQICFRKQIEAAEAHGLDRVFINVDFKLLESIAHRKKPADVEVILEISEKESLIDIEHHIAVAQEWRAEGYKFAFDDFGVGFISLPFLADLEPEYIKLDRLTILQAVASDEFRKFLNHVVLGLRQYAGQGIVAEGIETEEELAVVEQIGIHIVQGYLFGEPGPIDLGKSGSVKLPLAASLTLRGATPKKSGRLNETRSTSV